MIKHVNDNVGLTHGVGAVMFAFLIVCCGCFSSTRYTATLHPSQVKPASHIIGRYRVAKVLVKEPKIVKLTRMCMEKGWLGNPQGYMKFNELAASRGLNALQSIALWQSIEKFDIIKFEARHKLDTEMIYESMNSALTRLYPDVFSNDSDAIPLTIMISMDASYEIDYPFYYPMIAMFFWPLSADLETKYMLWVRQGDIQKNNVELWDEFDKNMNAKNSEKKEPTVVRSSEVWETMGLPIGAISIPGESQWPRKTGFIADNGTFKLHRSGSEILHSENCISQIAFVPEVDSEVLAAAVVQELNKIK